MGPERSTMLIISVIVSAILMGITVVEKKLFKIRLKEKAFEELKIYTDFFGAKIFVGAGGKTLRTVRNRRMGGLKPNVTLFPPIC